MERPRHQATIESQVERIGQEIGVSDWIAIDQAMVDAFATLTRDTYFIHTDPERAARETPFGGSIAHGGDSVFKRPFSFSWHPERGARRA